MPRISVIIPCYNTAQYLDRCVQSVLAQTQPDVELILVDDGSTDGTTSLCDSYAEKYGNIQALHIDNAGPATAKNRGFELATGEYISYIDSDDELCPEMYAKMLCLGIAEQADIVCCGYTQVDEDGNISHREHSRQTFAFDRTEGLRRLLDKDLIYSQGWTKIYRRDMLVQGHVRFIDGLKTEEDFLYNLDSFLASTRIAIDDTPYYIYTHRQKSLSREYHLTHALQFAGNMAMRLERTERLMRADFPALSRSLTLHCAAYYNLLLGRLAPVRESALKPFMAKAIAYMRHHAPTILRHHARCGLSLSGTLMLLLLPQSLYIIYRKHRSL